MLQGYDSGPGLPSQAAGQLVPAAISQWCITAAASLADKDRLSLWPMPMATTGAAACSCRQKVVEVL